MPFMRKICPYFLWDLTSNWKFGFYSEARSKCSSLRTRVIINNTLKHVKYCVNENLLENMPKTSERKSKVSEKKKKTKGKPTNSGNLAVDVEKQDAFEEQVDEIPTEASESGVVYVGHIPHGFYEEEMQKFFAQFGTVKRLRLSRSRKTGSSKGYAFVEFEFEDVAKIAAETMDNYLLFGRLLKCKYVPKDQLHPRIWQGAKRKFKKIDWAQRERTKHNMPKTGTSRTKLVTKLLKKEKKTRNKLESLGISYKFPGYAAQSIGTAKHKKFSDD